MCQHPQEEKERLTEKYVDDVYGKVVLFGRDRYVNQFVTFQELKFFTETACFASLCHRHLYRPEGKVMFSEESICSQRGGRDPLDRELPEGDPLETDPLDRDPPSTDI